MDEIAFRLTTTRFDEDYVPSAGSRITTNFANLARGANRRENLRAALAMMDRRLADLAASDDAERGRWAVELDIVSIELQVDAAAAPVPAIEMLDVSILDRRTGERHQGIVGNNFSSYLRDYDFSIALPAATADGGPVPEDFGDLHGRLFQRLVDSDAFRRRFPASPLICISVSTSRTYRRTAVTHPALGAEYVQEGSPSLTDRYFAKMGLQVRYFMPRGSVAPLAFYVRDGRLDDYTDLQLIGTVSTMETFQKIYRPEIYAARTVAGELYRPSLEQPDFEPTGIEYDREERSRLAVVQGRWAEEHLVRPYGALLERWTATELAGAR